MFVPPSAIRDVSMGKFCKQLGLSHGMKCTREDRIIQRTQHWVWGPATCVWAGTLSPSRCVTSWSNRDVNPCPVCWAGLLRGANETPHVKKRVFHKCKLLWFSLVVFGKLVSFYISHVFSTPPSLPTSPQSDQTCLPFSSEWGTSDLTKKEMKSPGLLSPSFMSGPREKHAPCKAELPRPRHPCRGEARQSTAVTTVWISLCRAPDKQRGKVQKSGSASEMWEGQQSLKCMGTGGNLILLQRGEGALHHVKIIASGQQSLGVRGSGLAHWPACRRTLILFCGLPAWMCRGHASTLLWVLTGTRDWTQGPGNQVPWSTAGGGAGNVNQNPLPCLLSTKSPRVWNWREWGRIINKLIIITIYWALNVS